MTYLSFPRQYARTQRYTLGAPRGFTVAADGGGRVVFARSRSGADRTQVLWVLDVASGEEWVAADPAELLGGAGEHLSPAERARRERSREGSAGVVGFAVDGAVRTAAFALSGRLFTAGLTAPREQGGAGARELAAPGPVIDPRPSPDGRWVAYASGGALRVVAADGAGDRALAGPGSALDGVSGGTAAPEAAGGTGGGSAAAGGGTEGFDAGAPNPDADPDADTGTDADTGSGTGTGSDAGATTGPDARRDADSDAGPGPGDASVTWGLAEFVAAEEMGRTRGFWWSPDSTALLVARVDESPVQRWWIAEPAHPDRAPVEVAYPAAGTANADVRLFLAALDGGRREIRWDRARHPYLAAVHWSAAGPPLLLVQARDQREQLYLEADPATGDTRAAAADDDRIWLDLFPGVPVRTPAGELVRIVDEDGARVLKVGDATLTGPDLHVRAVLDAGGPGVLVSASAGEAAADPGIGEVHVYRVDASGAARISAEPGVHRAVRAGELTVLTSDALDRPGARTRVLRGDAPVAEIASYAEAPSLTARPALLHAGSRRIPTAVLLPAGHTPADGPLPVLLDPYGGPHGQRVVAAHNAHLVSQWFADQGFAVIVADGRGTPGRSPGWEKSVAFELAAVTLEDQVAALDAVAETHPLDLSRVAIRGWSFGGYLAALAVLRRPDVFHAGVVGAPVSDLRLYDTHYQERYLGHPAEHPEAYARNSVVHDDGLVQAAEPARPMMIIHGLADDNVLVAHSLRLSSALLAAGRPHEVLPLSGVTHMTPQEQVAENLLLLQVDFLKRSLGLPPVAPG